MKAAKGIGKAQAPHNRGEGSGPFGAVLGGGTPRTPGVNPRVKRVVAISKKEDVDAIRETDFGRRGGVREEGRQGGVKLSVGGSLVPV